MKKKLKLAFDQLEQEMQLIHSSNLDNYKGGDSPPSWGDCVFHAIAFATGQSYQQVYNTFGTWAMTQSGWNATNSGVNSGYVVAFGMNPVTAGNFAQYMGLNNVGDTPHGPSGYSVSGDVSVAYLNYGDGVGHAVVLTGNASGNSYYYYDPQNNVTGTISATDPRIIGTYGY
jgi:hypothetical protein